MSKSQNQAGVEPMMQRLLREGSLILYFLLAVFLIIALVSYSPEDPGFTTTGTGSGIDNAVGVYGAWLADIMLHLLGYLAYGFPALLAYKLYTAFRETEQQEPFSWALFGFKTGGFLLLLIAACGLATLHFEISPDVSYFAGGVVGALVLDLSLPVLATLGSTLLFLALFLFGLTVTLHISWLAVIDTIGAATLAGSHSLLLALRKWVAARKEAMAAKERLETRKKVLDVHIEKERKRVPPTISEPVKKAPVPSQRVQKERQGTLFAATSVKELPAIALLDAWHETNEAGFSKESLEAMSKLLELKLNDFGIEIEVTAVNPGPVITRFEVQPAPGVKVSRISNLVKDLARSLAVISVRVVEVIPGKTVIGIEIPNEQRDIIQLSQVLSSPEFDRASSPLSLALGHDIVGKPVIVDLAKMPHLLVAGTTGSGKSVGINAMILSLLFKSTPEHVRMIMIDPKMLELSVYDGIPHLLTPVITDMKDAANGLRWCVAEMERRYKLMSSLGVRNLTGFNKKVIDAKKAGKPIMDPLFQPDPMMLAEEQAPAELEALPCVVVIVDELADMMMVVGKKVEELIARIA
ncbi:MAG: DNA translocase FtsK 4TM domain-containing protein, partial [Gammaproteobacteria bacterium]